MAVTTTARLGLTRWSAGTDAFSRAQLDADHAALEANAAMFVQGTAAARPAPGDAGRFHFASDTKALTYDDGTAWQTHVHTIADLPVAASGESSASKVTRSDDARLSDTRVPKAHTHPVSDMTATGTRDGTTFLAGDNTWKTVVANVTRVYYTGAAPARPTGATYVEWVGPNQPAGSVAGDTWVQTS